MTDWGSNDAGVRAPKPEVERVSVEQAVAYMVAHQNHSAPHSSEMPVCPECGKATTSWHAGNWTTSFGIRCTDPKCRWTVEAGADSSRADAWNKAQRVPDSDSKIEDHHHWLDTSDDPNA